MDEPERDVSEVDLARPNTARMYDYLLGGAANFAIDREAVADITGSFPSIVEWAWANRAFLARVVTTLSEYGIDQFLDLGSGVPTVGNVHELAKQHNPAARVAYIDIEPVAVNHARHLLADTNLVTITQADIRHPDQVLSAPGVTGLLDFTRPVAVLAFAILDITNIENPVDLLATYRQACVRGSALALSHGVITTLTDEQVQQFQGQMHNAGSAGAQFRSPDELAGFFAGYEILPPGVVPLDQWRPESPVPDEYAQQANCYGAVGILSASDQ